MHKGELEQALPELGEQESEMIKDVKISVRRNLEGYALGPGLRENQNERSIIEEKIRKSLEELEGDYKGQYYPLI